MAIEDKYTSAKATRLKNKKWRLRLNYKDVDGKWKSIYRTLEDTTLGKKRAQELAEDWRREMNEQSARFPTLKENDTISEVVRDYLEYQLRNNIIEKSTYTNQKSYLTKHVDNSIFGQIDFRTLDHVAIDRWLTELNQKGLKQATIGSVYSIVRKTYEYKQFTGEIRENPFDRIKKPKKSAPKVSYLDPDMMDYLQEVIQAEKGTPIATVIGIALYAGLRRGEISGLRWNNVDFDSGYITIDSAVSYGEGGSYTKQPKNESSNRTFKMNQPLIDLLEARKAVVEQEMGTIHPSWYVVGQGNKYFSPTSLSRHTKWFFDEHGIKDHYGKDITLHSLRHNYATQAVGSKNVDIAVLARMLGHSNIAMTLNTYSTDMATGMEQGADAMTAVFERKHNGTGNQDNQQDD